MGPRAVPTLSTATILSLVIVMTFVLPVAVAVVTIGVGDGGVGAGQCVFAKLRATHTRAEPFACIGAQGHDLTLALASALASALAVGFNGSNGLGVDVTLGLAKTNEFEVNV